jgi:hypothetical protein
MGGGSQPLPISRGGRFFCQFFRTVTGPIPARIMLQTLIFDVDGTLADTERDGHRPAFNRTFEEAGLDWHWDVALYGELLAVTGGKERMRHYVDRSMCSIVWASPRTDAWPSRIRRTDSGWPAAPV